MLRISAPKLTSDYIYIYIYILREREREKERLNKIFNEGDQ